MNAHKRMASLKNSFRIQQNLNRTVGKFTEHILKNYLFKLFILSLLFALILPLATAPVGLAQSDTAFIRQVRVMESKEAGVPNPIGLTFSARANAFQILGRQPISLTTDLIGMTPFADRAGTVRLAIAIQDPINVTLDNRSGRFLILDTFANQLLEVREDANGHLDPQILLRHNLTSLDLQDPQGMTFDAARGVLYILDAVGPQIVRVDPGSRGEFEGTTFSIIDLGLSGLATPRGLAFEAGTGNLHVVVPGEQELVELNQSGEIVATRDLTEFGLRNPQGMVFAPSSDQTDDLSKFNLFLADSGQSDGQTTSDAQSTGQILELSLIEPVTATAPGTFHSIIVKTTALSAVSPPSPDPSGITYLSGKNRLIVSDRDVEEMVRETTHFQGANVWELTPGGRIIRTPNISKRDPTAVPMTDEPTGVAWNPGNGHYYFTEDSNKRVYDLNPGADKLMGTGDDRWTFFSTHSAGNADPEGIAFDTWRNRLFVADGVNREIYQYTLGGSLVSHFDVAAVGLERPAGLEFNRESGTLFIMSSDPISPIIIETTITGILLQTIDISALNSGEPTGLAYAPASNGSGEKRFYIVDGGIDHGADPNVIDGKLHEITAPSSATPPLPPTHTTTPMGNPPARAILNSPSGSIESPRPTYIWSRVSSATWYYLWVNGPSGNVIKQWYQSASVCEVSICSVMPPTSLDNGTHTWWIRPWNVSGYGPWSTSRNFDVGP